MRAHVNVLCVSVRREWAEGAWREGHSAERVLRRYRAGERSPCNQLYFVIHRDPAGRSRFALSVGGQRMWRQKRLLAGIRRAASSEVGRVGWNEFESN